MTRLIIILVLCTAWATGQISRPVLIQTQPAVSLAGEGPVRIRLIGTGFVTGARVRIDNVERLATFTSSTSLTVLTQADDLSLPGKYEVRVVNPDGAASSFLIFSVNAAVPVLTSLAPSTIRGGSSSTQVSIQGSGFSKASTVLWNDQPRTATYLSSTSLQLTASALDLATAGSIRISVRNGSPGGGDSATAYLLISQALSANDLVWDPGSKRLLLSISSSATTNANTVAAILPELGFPTQYFPVGLNPGRMALSDDGTKLFVALNGEAALGKYSMPSGNLEAKYLNGTVPTYTFGPLQIEDLKIAPSQNTIVAASLMNPGVSPRHAGVAVYDATGRRNTTTPGHTGSNVIAFGASDPTTVYGLNNETTEFGFRRMKISASGIQVDKVLTDSFSTNFAGFGGFGGGFQIIHDNVVASSGAVLKKDTLETVAKLNASGTVVYNPGSDSLYFVSSSQISAFNASTYEFLGQARVSISGTPSRAVAIGTRGLAFLGNSFSSSQDLYIINDFVPSLSPVGLSSQAVVNGATLRNGPVAPGMIIVIFNTALSSGLAIGPDELAIAQPDLQSFPTTLANTRVTFDGIPAPMIYARKDVVAAVVPYAVAGRTQTQLLITYDGNRILPLNVPLVDSNPGLFTIAGSGVGQGAIVNQDGTVNSPSNPAARGSIVSLYGTGEGQTDPPGVDGQLALSSLPKPLLPVTARIGGLDADIQYAGGAYGLIAGLLLVNVLVPADITPGSLVPVLLQVGVNATPAAVTMAVK